MKRLVTLLCALISLVAYAQTDSLKEAYSRIKILEETIQQQNNSISKLTADVNEVLNQNLALKKNLLLKPTKAIAKTPDSMEYRVVEVNGDKSTGEVHVIMTSHNNGETDITSYYSDNEIIDELGNGYNDKKRHYIKVKGISDNLFRQTLDHHPNTPYTLDLCIEKYNLDSQYIKYISISTVNGSKHHHVIFENLPIKWADSSEE